MKTDLHEKFVLLGKQRHKLTYEILALLPKIHKRGIHKKHGFESIFQYAFILAGLTESQVKKALKLNENLKNKPHLQKAIQSQGIHKVAIVSKISTPETDKFYADKVENMSKSALIQLRKEVVNKGCPEEEKMKIELDSEMQFMFLKLKKKIGNRLSNKETLRRMLKKMMHKNKKTQQKAKIKPKNPGTQIARYIPAHTKRIAIANGKCSHPGCNKPYRIIHHKIPFAISKNHNSIRPLCKNRHEFAHNGLIEGEGHREIDKLYKKYRKTCI